MKLNKNHQNKSGIYCIENIINNKRYIGQSKNIYQRVSSHMSFMKSNVISENRYLRNSVKKYGIDSFRYYVLEYLDIYDEQLLKELELKYIQQYDSANPECGYNCKKDNGNECNVVRQSTKDLNRLALKKRYDNFSKQQLDDYYLKISNSRSNYFYLQCDLNRNIIKEYTSRKHIKLENPSYHLPSISGCCLGNKNNYKGYIWIHKDKETGYIYYNKLKTPIFLQHKNRK